MIGLSELRKKWNLHKKLRECKISSLCGNSLATPQKVKCKLALDPVFHSSVYNGIVDKRYSKQCTDTRMFTAGLFTTAKMWRQTKCLSADGWINKCGLWIQRNIIQPLKDWDKLQPRCVWQHFRMPDVKFTLCWFHVCEIIITDSWRQNGDGCLPRTEVGKGSKESRKIAYWVGALLWIDRNSLELDGSDTWTRLWCTELFHWNSKIKIWNKNKILSSF